MKISGLLGRYNIYFRGQFISEDALIQDAHLPENAVMFREGDSLQDTFLPGFLAELPLLLLMIGLTIVKYREMEMHLQLRRWIWVTILCLVLLNWLLTYAHEILHGVFYPKDEVKSIWKDKEQGLWFIHCGAVVSRWQFFVVGMAPVFFLGILPFGIWYLAAPYIPQPWNLIWVLTSWYMVLGAMGDFCNVLNLVLQVPKGAKMLNYGLHSYWLKPEGYVPGRKEMLFQRFQERIFRKERAKISWKQDEEVFQKNREIYSEKNFEDAFSEKCSDEDLTGVSEREAKRRRKASYESYEESQSGKNKTGGKQYGKYWNHPM